MVWAVAKEPSIAAKLKSELIRAFPDRNVAPDYTVRADYLDYLQVPTDDLDLQQTTLSPGHP